jgi:hypothetical protein
MLRWSVARVLILKEQMLSVLVSIIQGMLQAEKLPESSMH